MTKPKRYQGEALRAEQWHNMSREEAWLRQSKGMLELQRIVHGKFDVYCNAQYDPVDCGYFIVTEIAAAKPPRFTGIRTHTPTELVMVHVEPYLEFPSDHLKTKLILLAG